MQDKATSVHENCALLGYYAGGCGIYYRRFREHLSGSIFKVQTLEEGTDRLSRNVGKKLPLHAA